MKYAIVYSSRTGNTAMLAEKIEAALPEVDCIYSGAPDEKAMEAEQIFVGFWTDKGTCDETIADFLKHVRNQKIFLFGTAGFGASGEYFLQILQRVKAYVDSSNIITGSYMCQGKMPVSVREHYETMLTKDPVRMNHMIENFDLALSHPDEHDFERLEKVVKKHLSMGI